MIMKTIRTALSDILNQVLSSQFNIPLRPSLVQASDRPDLADYQSNIALMLTKQLKKSPRSIAETIVQNWPKADPTQVSIAGPGFINFRLTDQQLVDSLNETSLTKCHDPSLHQKKIVMDYGGPNVAKPMHVGHLRSSIIGECLKRLYRFAGAQVISDIHLGDWGTQMGMLIVGLKQRHPDWIYFHKNHTGSYPEESPINLEDLEEIYPKISAACKENTDLAEACRQATHELQQGRSGYVALWQHFVDVSLSAMKQEFRRLGVSFEHWFGESRYQAHLQPLVQSFQDKGVAEVCEGAVIVAVEKPDDKKPMPPVILQKKDGGFLYATTDLATIDERLHHFQADQIIYVVDNRQALHFEQVFRAAALYGWHVDWSFVGFGTMNGPDGKPFKTRKGGVMRLKDLIDTLTEQAKERLLSSNKEYQLTPEALDKTAHQIGLAALKFADLQHDPKQNYQFDIDKFMRFEGKTGPYLQYAAVRIQSLLEKANLDSFGKSAVQAPADLPESARDVCIHLTRFPEIIQESLAHKSPNILCEAAFQLTQSFSRFYNAAPILTESNQSIRTLKINLCQQTFATLQRYLDILGIEIPQRM